MNLLALGDIGAFLLGYHEHLHDCTTRRRLRFRRGHASRRILKNSVQQAQERFKQWIYLNKILNCNEPFIQAYNAVSTQGCSESSPPHPHP